jgi:pyridoxal phosphate-dependent aminotransferase EpsN
MTVDQQQFGVDCETIRPALAAEAIEAHPVWKSMHLQPAKTGCEAVGGAVAEEFFANGLCLPSGSNLSESDLARVVDVIRCVSQG